jgi:hypothetical protein
VQRDDVIHFDRRSEVALELAGHAQRVSTQPARPTCDATSPTESVS